MEIQGRTVSNDNYLEPVTLVPKGSSRQDPGPWCEQGVIINVSESMLVRVLYCRGRKVISTSPDDLVWG